jgi:predicted Na+-dependent transporter
MFAVGVNSSPKDFIEAIKRPDAIVAGYIGQFIIKPLLGFLFGTVAVTIFNLPTALGKDSFLHIPYDLKVTSQRVHREIWLGLYIGAGIMLVSCVSGAQLSNYATFLTDPQMAPLSIVMTSLSTGTAVFVTPTLSYLLIGKKLPVDVKGMMSSIVQIVVAPIAAGLLLNRYSLHCSESKGATLVDWTALSDSYVFWSCAPLWDPLWRVCIIFLTSSVLVLCRFLPRLCAAIQPFLPPLSVFVTALCVGSPLAINIKAVLSPFGLAIVLLLFAFHASSFVAGYHLTGTWFHKSADVKALQRTISFETGKCSFQLHEDVYL